MSKAHVICCNDAVMAVCLGTEDEAKAAMEPLGRADFDRNPWHWQGEFNRYHDGAEDAYGYYRKRCYWHLHDAPIVG